MGILFLFLFGIVAILVIAKLASKVRPEEEVLKEKKRLKELKDKKKAHMAQQSTDKLEALISVLVKKQIVSEEELLVQMKEDEKK